MNNGIGEKVALVALIGAVGYGIYAFLRPKPKPADIELLSVNLGVKGKTGQYLSGGNIIQAQIEYRNKGEIAFATEWRLDIRVARKTWKEGQWHVAEKVEPKETGSGVVESAPVPMDWRGKVSVKLMLKGIEEEIWGPKFGEGIDVFIIEAGAISLTELEVLYTKEGA